MPMLTTMITTQNPSCSTSSFSTTKTKDRTTKFITKSEWIRFFDESSCIRANLFYFVGFLVFSIFTGCYAVKVVSYVFWELECYRVHSVHFVNELFDETIVASWGWIS